MAIGTLSERATRYLATLERRTAVPTVDVEAILRNEGHPVFAVWLEFHDRYAGYVEVWDRDWAVWGLAHEQPYWLGPRSCEVEKEPYEEVWTIMCADSHPSFNYILDQDGEFYGPHAESFDVKVERTAARWVFTLAGGLERIPSEELRDAVARERLISDMKPYLVTEASDRYFRHYMSTTHLLVEDLSTSRLHAWRHPR